MDFPKRTESSRRHKSTARTCETRGCPRSTREGKPHCPEHVDEHPYVQSILSALAGREREEAKVRSRGSGAVDLSGMTAKEVVMHLELRGASTVERLSRDLRLDVDVLEGYVRALVKNGVVGLAKTRRGSTLVRLSK